jgi:hypothetical protein
VPGAEASDDPAAVIALRDIKATLEEAQEADDAEEETLDIEYGGGIMKMMFMKLSADNAVKVAEQAASLRTACQKNKEELALVTLNGAADSLVSAALAVLQVPSALAPILEALAVVLMDPEGRETLGQRGVAALTAILRRHPEDAGVVRSGFMAVRASMLVHENHRQQFVAAAKVLKLILPALKHFAEDPPTFLAACGALRASTLSDDLRAKTSKGLEHAKAAVELKVLPILLDATKGCVGKHSTSALAELLATLSRLTVTDQICSQLSDMNALPLAIQELSNNMVDASVAKQACFFLASISGNDNCKVSIVEGNGHVAIIQAMLLHPNNAGMQTDAVSALGNMCLRVPENCEAIAAADGIPAICQAFTQHVTHPRMQSKGPLCIRNMVGRNPEHIPAFLEGYVESALRQIMAQHDDGYVHNLAKAALREMHLKVDLKEQFQGTLENAHTLENGDVDGENHWDKFLETPVAQEAIRREMEEAGVTPDAYLDQLK